MKDRLLGDKLPKQMIEKIKEKFPVTKCREVLGKRKKVFTDEELLMIRDFLINISDIAYQVFQKRVQAELDSELDEKVKIIQLNKQNENDSEIKKAA